MTDFQLDIKRRNIPQVLPEGMTAEKWPSHRRKLLELFCKEEYGFSPPPPKEVRAKTLSDDPVAWAGKAYHRQVCLSFDTPMGEFAFPVDIVLPKSGKNLPVIVYISFTPYPCGKYGPIEELVDQGYGLAIFDNNAITLDGDDNFTGGIAAMYDRSADDGSLWGKISMWAWGASRVMDYLQTLREVDKNRIYVIGHSRLGKTALWCAAQDLRFAGAGINNSGCSGMAITRGKMGEKVADIVSVFPYWFCKNYHKYVNREDDLPFEQSMLAAMIAPRPLAVSNAEEDIWADPVSEYISLIEAHTVYRLLSTPGLVASLDRFPDTGTSFNKGRIAYNLRSGTHFMSRHDWLFYLDYFKTQMEGTT